MLRVRARAVTEISSLDFAIFFFFFFSFSPHQFLLRRRHSAPFAPELLWKGCLLSESARAICSGQIWSVARLRVARLRDVRGLVHAVGRHDRLPHCWNDRRVIGIMRILSTGARCNRTYRSLRARRDMLRRGVQAAAISECISTCRTVDIREVVGKNMIWIASES